MKMTSNGKTLNYKVVDLVGSYNFHIKFTSIRVQKNYKFSKKDWTPTTVGHVSRSLPPSLSFAKKKIADHIFLQKKRKEKCKKRKNSKKMFHHWHTWIAYLLARVCNL
jgi:hypothetical protein